MALVGESEVVGHEMIPLDRYSYGSALREIPPNATQVSSLEAPLIRAAQEWLRENAVEEKG